MIPLLVEFNSRYSAVVLCGITFLGDISGDKRASPF